MTVWDRKAKKRKTKRQTEGGEDQHLQKNYITRGRRGMLVLGEKRLRKHLVVIN